MKIILSFVAFVFLWIAAAFSLPCFGYGFLYTSKDETSLAWENLHLSGSERAGAPATGEYPRCTCALTGVCTGCARTYKHLFALYVPNCEHSDHQPSITSCYLTQTINGMTIAIIRMAQVTKGRWNPWSSTALS